MRTVEVIARISSIVALVIMVLLFGVMVWQKELAAGLAYLLFYLGVVAVPIALLSGIAVVLTAFSSGSNGFPKEIAIINAVTIVLCMLFLGGVPGPRSFSGSVSIRNGSESEKLATAERIVEMCSTQEFKNTAAQTLSLDPDKLNYVTVKSRSIIQSKGQLPDHVFVDASIPKGVTSKGDAIINFYIREIERRASSGNSK